jgi:ribosomal protein L27
MALSRLYPNSIVPNGSTVRGCLENDDKELKRVLELLSTVQTDAGSGTYLVRQRGTTYSKGEEVYAKELSRGWTLRCTAAGQTAANDLGV